MINYLLYHVYIQPPNGVHQRDSQNRRSALLLLQNFQVRYIPVNAFYQSKRTVSSQYSVDKRMVFKKVNQGYSEINNLRLRYIQNCPRII